MQDRRDGSIGRRFVVFTAAFWLPAAGLLGATGVGRSLEVDVTWPVAFRARELLGRSPPLHPQLKILSMDDRTYAALRHPSLTSGDWARILDSLTPRRPRAVVIPHGFGSRGDEGEALQASLERAEQAGTAVLAAVLAVAKPIAYREPLSVDLAQLAEPPRVPPAKRYGWALYGPPPEVARRFTALGHIAYDDAGQTPAYIEVAPGRVIPHLSLAGISSRLLSPAAGAREELAPPVDDAGSLQIDVAPLATYAKRAASLHGLLTDRGPEVAARLVEAGDVVLILPNMFTGGASFNPTPLGTLPNGYIFAATLNSALRGVWLERSAHGGFLALLGAALGLSFGLLSRARLRVLAFATLLLGPAAFGIAAFVYGGVLVAWLPPLVVGIGAAATLEIRRTQLRLRLERRRNAAAAQENAKLSAIVRTAQMFAHDVRKPFSLLRIASQTLQRELSPEAAARILQRLGPEIERSLGTVEGMLQDVMHIDGAAELRLEAIELAGLLVEVLREVFTIRHAAEVQLSYRFEHTLPAWGDRPRLRRVVGNVVDNAVQAVNHQGYIWIETKDVVEETGSFVAVTIGNSGSFVAPEHRERLFEAFFTFGKKGGTGLGLAIAHKVVSQHGGRIWCESSPAWGTEFHFLLPVAQGTPQKPPQQGLLPSTAAAFRAMALGEAIATDAAPGGHRQSEGSRPAAARFAPAPAVKDRPWLAVLDDNALLLEAWQAAVSDARVFAFPSPSAFWRMAEAEPTWLEQLDAVVTDYYFDQPGEDDGVAFAELLRSRMPGLPVFLSSDATLEQGSVGTIEACIDKDPVAYDDLMRRRRAG